MTTNPTIERDWLQARESHAALSPVDVEFREYAMRTPECLRQASFSDPEREPLLQFPRQPWPLFVSPGVVDDLAAAAFAVSGLVRSIPERIFAYDTARMAAFYGRDRDFIRLVLTPPTGIAEAQALRR